MDAQFINHLYLRIKLFISLFDTFRNYKFEIIKNESGLNNDFYVLHAIEESLSSSSISTEIYSDNIRESLLKFSDSMQKHAYIALINTIVHK